MINSAKQINTLQGYEIELRPIEESDLTQLLEWRNRHDIRIMMKNQELISFDTHLAWFQSLADKHTQQHFAIDYKGQLIGSANISLLATSTEGDEAQFEPGLYIGHDKYKGNIIAFAPSLVLNDYCFTYLSASRLIATVHKQNETAIAYNKKLCYQLYDEQDEWIKMTLVERDYQQATKVIRGFLSR